MAVEKSYGKNYLTTMLGIYNNTPYYCIYFMVIFLIHKKIKQEI